MTNDAASLDRLHDIVTPSAVPWWPLAPGWFFLAAILVIVVFVLVLRIWRRWRANASRREALHALASTSDVPAIAALLRRTALSEFSRPEIATLHGDAWVEWLAARSAIPLPPALRTQLSTDCYSKTANPDATALREWAAHWIASHHNPRNG